MKDYHEDQNRFSIYKYLADLICKTYIVEGQALALHDLISTNNHMFKREICKFV